MAGCVWVRSTSVMRRSRKAHRNDSARHSPNHSRVLNVLALIAVKHWESLERKTADVVQKGTIESPLVDKELSELL